MLFKIIILTVFCGIAAEKVTYYDYKVYKVVPFDEGQVEELYSLKGGKGIDFWTEDFQVNSDVRIMVSPEVEEYFVNKLKSFGLDGNLLITNVQDLIDDQLKVAKTAASSTERLGSFSWNRYHTLEEIYNWLDELAEMYPNVVTIVSLGKSTQDRDIKGVVINYNPARGPNVTTGMIEGAIHAREWITPATITWIIKEFLTSSNSDIRALARNVVWHIFPVVNPDGYSYSFTNVRMWRKNRNTEYYTDCGPNEDNDLSNGVDLNRNFDFAWRTVSASDDPCSNIFAGPVPRSEVETRAIENYVRQLSSRGKFIYYIAFHSFTQLLIVPHGNLALPNALQVENYADMFEVVARTAEAIKQRFDTRYRFGLSDDVMYKMSGTSFDWVRNETNVPMCFLFELRDLGFYGFLLPPDQIIPNNLEIMDGMLEMDRNVRLMGYYRAGASTAAVSASIFALGVIFSLFF